MFSQSRSLDLSLFPPPPPLPLRVSTSPLSVGDMDAFVFELAQTQLQDLAIF
jgi:hypothetical protein